MSVLEYSNEVASRHPKEWTIHPCKLCKFKTASVFFFTNHTKRHSSGLRQFNCETSSVEMYFCKDCNYTTNMMAVLNMHIKTCHLGMTISETDLAIATRQKYLCNCGFNTCSYLIWYKHEISKFCKIQSCLREPSGVTQLEQNGIQWLACEKCEFRTKHTVSMKRHKCDKWGYTEKLNSYMKDHIKQIIGDEIQGYACDKCDYRTKQKVTMRRHVAFKHLEKNEIWWFKCNKCDFRAIERHALNRHLVSAHEIQRYECDKCDYKVKTKVSLERHRRFKHLGEDEIRPFECSHCDYKSSRRPDLKRHMICNHLQSDEIRWFRCDKCDFKTKLTIHLKTHVKRRHSSCGGLKVVNVVTDQN